MTAVVANLPATPYKGLANYTEQDATLFFGRDREREVIIANLKARRLTLLYGESGVGKSSLLRAGVMSDLAEAARRNLADLGTPEHVPVIFSAWSDEPVAGLGAAIRTAVDQFVGEPAEPPESASLAAVIDWAAEATDAFLLIVLDQFEEYFLYHPSEDGPGTFATEFPGIVNRPDIQANVLVSIREDALAKLDRFKGDIPRLFDSSLRVNHLDTAAAREAIERPVDRYNAFVEPGERVVLGAGLVDAVIEQVRSGRVVLEQTGQGTLGHGDGADVGADRIETPYLQLVMSRLWDVEEVRGSPMLHAATLAELGGAQEIVRTHLDGALHGLDPQERDTAAALFHQLVTPSGTKIAHAVPDLAEYARRPEPEVRDLLEKLAGSDTRILRPVPPPPGEEGPPRFEIFHDVLAPSVLAWRTRQTAAKRIEEQRVAARAATRRRLLRLLGAFVAVAFAAVALLALLANAQRNEAQQQEARARTLAAESNQQEALAREFADEAQRQERRARRNAGRADKQAAKASRLAAANGRRAVQARALAAENRRQAAEAQALASENRRRAAAARALARQNRRNADRAEDEAARANRLTDLANQAAARADRLADRVKREKAESDRLARTNQSLATQLSSHMLEFSAPVFWYASAGRRTRFLDLAVSAPAGAVVRAACRPRGCDPFQHAVGASPERVPIRTIKGEVIPRGTRIRLLVTVGDSGRFVEMLVARTPATLPRWSVQVGCRPAGASVPPGEPVFRCPEV